MVAIFNDSHEMNQLMWWSNWSRLVWFTNKCCALLSNDFDEPLFNHSEILSPKVNIEHLYRKVEIAFRRKGLTPCFFVKDSVEYEHIMKFLMTSYYKNIDQLSFMEIASPSFNRNKKVEVELIGKDGIEKWCEIYLLSFYGDKKLFEPVVNATKRALTKKKTRLVLARYKDLPAGTLALYDTGGLSGAYCVGTLPRFRSLGIASKMLEFAYKLSRENGKKLVLQTFLSDSVENFYINRGFRRSYLKTVLIRT